MQTPLCRAYLHHPAGLQSQQARSVVLLSVQNGFLNALRALSQALYGLPGGVQEVSVINSAQNGQCEQMQMHCCNCTCSGCSLISILSSHAGKLTARNMCAVIAHLQPQGAIIVDESLTSGGAYWDLSKVCMLPATF